MLYTDEVHEATLVLALNNAKSRVADGDFW